MLIPILIIKKQTFFLLSRFYVFIQVELFIVQLIQLIAYFISARFIFVVFYSTIVSRRGYFFIAFLFETHFVTICCLL